MKFNDLKKELLGDSKFKKDYFEKDEEYYAIEIGSNILEQRILSGLTQEDLAKKIGTQQPSIARAENGSQLQSNSFLLKLAQALGVSLEDLLPSKKEISEIKSNSEGTKDEPIKSFYWNKRKDEGLKIKSLVANITSSNLEK